MLVIKTCFADVFNEAGRVPGTLCKVTYLRRSGAGTRAISTPFPFTVMHPNQTFLQFPLSECLTNKLLLSLQCWTGYILITGGCPLRYLAFPASGQMFHKNNFSTYVFAFLITIPAGIRKFGSSVEMETNWKSQQHCFDFQKYLIFWGSWRKNKYLYHLLST